MTAAPRRRRHDPLAPTGSGRVEPPGPSTIDLHTHTTRSDGVVAPTELRVLAHVVVAGGELVVEGRADLGVRQRRGPLAGEEVGDVLGIGRPQSEHDDHAGTCQRASSTGRA